MVVSSLRSLAASPQHGMNDFSSLVESQNYRVELGHGVWLMDNHKWALLAWEKARTSDQRYALMHADYHWDGIDVLGEVPERLSAFQAAGLQQLEDLTKADELVRFDSFIAAAVRRGFVSEVHFFCAEDEGNDEGLYQPVCDQYGARQFIYADVEDFSAATPADPVIFDLCLDLFNRSNDEEYGEDLWSEEEILGFLDAVAHHISSAAVVTVSLSFGFSGTPDGTRHLAALVVPRILALRQA